jgi:hypothetical protein
VIYLAVLGEANPPRGRCLHDNRVLTMATRPQTADGSARSGTPARVVNSTELLHPRLDDQPLPPRCNLDAIMPIAAPEVGQLSCNLFTNTLVGAARLLRARINELRQ